METGPGKQVPPPLQTRVQRSACSATALEWQTAQPQPHQREPTVAHAAHTPPTLQKEPAAQVGQLRHVLAALQYLPAGQAPSPEVQSTASHMGANLKPAAQSTQVPESRHVALQGGMAERSVACIGAWGGIAVAPALAPAVHAQERGGKGPLSGVCNRRGRKPGPVWLPAQPHQLTTSRGRACRCQRCSTRWERTADRATRKHADVSNMLQHMPILHAATSLLSMPLTSASCCTRLTSAFCSAVHAEGGGPLLISAAMFRWPPVEVTPPCSAGVWVTDPRIAALICGGRRMGPGWVHHVGRWVARAGVGQGWLSIGWKGGGLATCMLKTKICCAWLLVHERSEHVVSFQQQLAVTSSHVAEG